MAVPTIVGSAVLTGSAANCSTVQSVVVPVPSGTQAGDIIIAIIAGSTNSTESYAWAVSPVTAAPWTVIAMQITSGTLVYQAWAAVYSTSLDRSFIGNLGDSSTPRRILPTAVTVRGAAPISNWVLGAKSKRTDTGTSTTTVASSINSLLTDTLVTGIFTERTTATETNIVSVSGATENSYLYDPSNTSIETVTVTEQVLVSPQSSGNVTVTYVNPQTSNGIGQLVGIPSISSVPAAIPQQIGYVVGEVDATTGAVSTSITLDPSTPTSGTVPAANDWMVAIIGVNANNGCGTFSMPTGWISINDSYSLVNTYNTKVLVRRRQTTDTTYTFTNSGDRSLNGALFWVRGGARLSQWVIGAPKFRADSPAETTTITCLPVTVAPNSLVLSLAFERTSASELASDITASGATKWFTAPQAGSLGIITLSAASEPVVSGTSSQVTFSYPNPQSTNGWGYQIAIPGEVQGDGYPVILQASDGTREARLLYQSGTGPAMPSALLRVPEGYATVSTMLSSGTFYAAHRGGSRSYPEMSLYAYTQSIIDGYGVVELSLARTSDGVWFGLHDSTLDRTSGVTGVTAASITWAQVQTYNILGSNATDNPTQPSRPYMRWEELIAAYYPSHIIFVDPKTALSYRSELLAMMDALPGTPQDHLIAKYYGVEGGTGNTGWANDAANHGYERWGYFYQADAANFATYQGRWSILGMDYAADQATWTAILSYGKPVIGHVCPNQAAVTTALGYGAAGLMISGVAAVTP